MKMVKKNGREIIKMIIQMESVLDTTIMVKKDKNVFIRVGQIKKEKILSGS